MTQKTEQTPNGLATYHEATFRTYAPEIVIHKGKKVRVQLCESLEEGRWEGFYSYTKMEGAK